MGQSETSTFLPFTMKLVLFFVFLSHELHLVAAGGSKLDEGSSSANESGTCSGSNECKEGVILPIWTPENPSFSDKLARATVYFVGLAYMFLGVSIIADRFMASIEVITSQEKEIHHQEAQRRDHDHYGPHLERNGVQSDPHGFGFLCSRAYSLWWKFADTTLMQVNWVRTPSWAAQLSTCSSSSPMCLCHPGRRPPQGVVEVWEGLLTLFFFPICVVFAWVADRRLLFYKYVYKRYRVGKQRGMIIETEGEPELQSKADIEMDGPMLNSHGEEFLDGAVNAEMKDMDEEKPGGRWPGILKELKQKHPEKEMEQLIELANYQVLSQQQKSRAFYRCQATRLMTGAGNILKKHAADQARRAICTHELRSEVSENDFSSKIFFDPGTYQCLENCGSVALNIVRRGGDLTSTISVNYRTEDGTANAGSDYQFAEGVMSSNQVRLRRKFEWTSLMMTSLRRTNTSWSI
ncbi:hypothetical protein SRHO_G00310710 [Serrasalmus rhombeus]